MSESDELAAAIGAAAKAGSYRVAAAESVTAGMIAQALASAPGASDWFAGSIVAYGTETKQRVLGVTDDRVITTSCARQMAAGALDATGAELVVAVTGVGGPDPEEGHPAGVVFMCAGKRGELRDFEHAFAGDPQQVVWLASLHALRHLRDATTLDLGA